MEITIKGDSKEIAALVVGIQERQGSAALNCAGPPVNIIRSDFGFRGSGGPSYNSSVLGSVTIENFGNAIEALTDIKGVLCNLCSLIENSGVSLPIER